MTDAPALLQERSDLGDGQCALIVTLNRPEALNALSLELFSLLEALLVEVDRDRAVRVVLLTGAGRAFCAGGDLKSLPESAGDPLAFTQRIDLANRMFRQVRHLTKPVVCLVNGVAAAGGLELMLSADFSFAARSARIGDVHQRYGLMGGGGVLALLPRVIGASRARELVYSGRLLTAGEAEHWGLVNRVVDDADLLDAGLGFARELARTSPLAISKAKFAMNFGWGQGMGVESALALELQEAADYSLNSHDAREGVAAFVEKRQPRFTGQ